METFQVKFWLTDAVPSLAVIVTVNGPVTEALAAMVPLIMPALSIDRPGGSVLPAVKFSVSVASKSVKKPETSKGLLPWMYRLVHR